MKMWQDLCEFSSEFGLPQPNKPTVKIDKGLMEFRIKFMQEELDEFVEAVKANNRVKAFDALIDLVYVAIGTAWLCNFPWQKGWGHVHFANMRKERALHDGSNSKRGSAYDIVKPDGWKSPEPCLEAELMLHHHYEDSLYKREDREDI